jgi:cation transport regulator ChaB
MPKTTRSGDVKQEELPSTLRRSPKKAQETFAKTHDSAVEQYGEGRRAHQTAYGALKHSFEKIGDHWEPKERKGPSDEQSAKGGAASSKQYPSAEGVDANASKSHLQDVARRLDIRGRSSMTKSELVDAIMKANRRQSAAHLSPVGQARPTA